MASNHEEKKIGSAEIIWRLSGKKEGEARQAVSGKAALS